MLDRSALDRLRQTLGDDPADLVDLLETFLADAPDILVSMEAAAQAGDPGVVRRHAHSLKSNARDLGAMDLAVICATLEGDLREGRDPGDLRARVADVRAEWVCVTSDLNAEIARIGAAG
jgi:HPt (histidine-containing phosphotransfer) domain-containing protein